MSLRDVTIAWVGKRGYRVRVTSCTGSARRIWGIWRKLSRVETRHRTRRVDFRLLAEALCRCRTRWGWGWGRWKSQNRKIVPFSPYFKKALHSKVIKSFVPELRSRKCFLCFEIPMFYVLYVMNSVCTFRVAVFDNGTLCIAFTYFYMKLIIFK